MNIISGFDAARKLRWARAAALVSMLLLPSALNAQSLTKSFILQKPAKPVAQFEFKDSEGRTRTLVDYRGRIVLLNLWATWCAPCRREMPTLDRLQEMMGGPEFEVVALSLDKADKKKVVRFLKEIGTTHLTYYQDQTFKAARALKTIGLPTTLLIDREGREIGRLIGPAEWDSWEALALIEKYLKRDRRSQSRILRISSLARVCDSIGFRDERNARCGESPGWDAETLSRIEVPTP